MTYFREIVLCILAFIAGAISSFIFVRNIHKKMLEEIKFAIHEYSKGNMLYRIDLNKIKNKNTSMLNSLETLKNLLKDWIFQFIRSSTVIVSSTNEVKVDAEGSLAAMNSLSDSVEAFAAGVQGVNNEILNFTALSQQLTVSITEVASISERMNKEANITRETVNSGTKAIENAMKSIEAISQSLQNSGNEIRVLSGLMNEVQGIAGKINAIAYQINLLSLNASIEAARAGEHGKGFAVVAEEVGKLADESAHAATEIGGIINNIIGQVESTLTNVEHGIHQGEQSEKITANARIHLQEITESMDKIVNSINNITESIGENARATEDMAENMEKIAAFSQETMSTIDEIEHMMDSQKRFIKASFDNINELDEVSTKLNKFSSTFDRMLGEYLIKQSEELAEHVVKNGINQKSIKEFALKTGGVNFCISDGDGLMQYSSDDSIIGFRLPEDQNSQAYEFRKILKDPSLKVVQPMKKRDVDSKYYKFVGIARKDSLGVVQAALALDDLERLNM